MPGGAGERRFPKSRRLLAPEEFAAVFDSGKRQHTASFTFVVAIRASRDRAAGARLGVTVSRKVALNAATRNAIKRQIRESFRHHQAMLDQTDTVVIAKRAAATVSREALRRQLDAAWPTLAARCKKF